MRTLKFEGYSDDTFGEYGVAEQDIDNCASLEPIQCVIDCGERGRLMVIGQYSKASCGNGCWMVGISKVDENDTFPDWNIKICQSAETPYSTAAFIQLPEGSFNLIWYKNGRKVEN